MLTICFWKVGSRDFKSKLTSELRAITAVLNLMQLHRSPCGPCEGATARHRPWLRWSPWPEVLLNRAQVVATSQNFTQFLFKKNILKLLISFFELKLYVKDKSLYNLFSDLSRISLELCNRCSCSWSSWAVTCWLMASRRMTGSPEGEGNSLHLVCPWRLPSQRIMTINGMTNKRWDWESNDK